MGVHDHPWLPERPTQDDVGGLAADAVQLEQLFHRLWDDPAETLVELARHHLDGARLLMIEPGRLDAGLELGGVCRREVGGRLISREQRRRHLVHLRVGALGRENRGHQQLKRVVVSQRQASDRVAPGQDGRDLCRTRAGAALRLACGQPERIGGHGTPALSSASAIAPPRPAGNASPAPKPGESPHDKEATTCTSIGSRVHAPR
jgi:hypothetical protein